MKKGEFSLTQYKDGRVVELVKKTDRKLLAVWAMDCAERVLPYFYKDNPGDDRPRKAIEALQTWIKTGIFKMAVIRQASLASDAAARDVGENNAARSAARAAGQAVATAHVPTHSLGAAIYALQAVFRASDVFSAELAVVREKDWQYQHLIEIRERFSKLKNGPN
jgi:hypothetical protein